MKNRTKQEMAAGVAARMRVVEALGRLLARHDFESLTVAQICEETGIARSTFYYYFDDKYEVIQWHFDHVAAQYLAETGRTLTWMQALYRNTQAVAKLKDLYFGAFSTRGYQSLFSYSKRRRVETLHETLTEYKHLEVDDALELQIFALAEAEVACISRWFKQGMPYDIETLCTYLVGIVPRRLYELLDPPIDPQLY